MKGVALGLAIAMGACTDPAPAALSIASADGTAQAAITFPATVVGGSSHTEVRVTNTGDARTGSLSLGASGPFSISPASTCSGASLAAGETCTVEIGFMPSSAGMQSGIVTVAGAPGGTSTATLEGAAVATIMVTPSPMDFDTVEVGGSKSLVAHVANIDPGAVALAVTATAPFAIASSSCPASLAGGASCDLNLTFAPTALGAVAGTLNIVADGVDHDTMLSGVGARRITVTVVGPGGHVTSAPAGIDCGSGCTSLYTGAVTLTASPAVGSTFSGWSDTTCGAAVTCSIPSGMSEVAITATFVASNAVALPITFAGNGEGSVAVRALGVGGGLIGTCTGSCSVAVTPGTTYEITGSTPQGWGGFAGTCTATPPRGQCTFTAGAGDAVTATFTRDPAELFTFSPSASPTALAFDSHDDLLVGTSTTLTKVAPTGAPLWTLAQSTDGLATGSDDRVYVVSGSTLLALDAAGWQLWSRAIGGPCTGDVYPRLVAAGLDNDVAVVSATGLSLFDTTGAVRWTQPSVSTWRCEVGIDSLGSVYVNAADQPEEITAMRFSRAGAPLAELRNVGMQQQGNFAITTGDHIGGSAAGFHHLFQSSQSTAGVSDFVIDNQVFPVVTPPSPWNAVAARGAGFAFATSPSNGLGFDLAIRSLGGSLVWELLRPALTTLDAVSYGWMPALLAGSASRVAIAGTYQGTPILQVFAP